MKPFELARPETVREATSALEEKKQTSRLLAGGTDLLGLVKDGIESPERVVNLKRIPQLQEITVSDDALTIGALVRLADVAAHPLVRKEFPALATTIEKTATPNIRNVGTLGGNICQRVRCWYFRHDEYPCLKKGGTFCYAQQGENEYHAIFDNQVCCAPSPSNTAPVLIAYDAEFEIAGGEDSKRVSAESFFVSPTKNPQKEVDLDAGEVLTQIRLPRTKSRRSAAYVETREKQSFDWALAGATVVLGGTAKKIDACRIVLSAVAPTPIRREDLEREVIGSPLTDERIVRIAKAATTGARPLTQNEYKVRLVRVILERALRQAREGL